jgi:hypothetical protein
MQPNGQALTWTAIIKQIRHLEPPEAIAYTMAQGYSQEAATDLVMDYQKHRLKARNEKPESQKFSESEFFRRIRERNVKP